MAGQEPHYPLLDGSVIDPDLFIIYPGGADSDTEILKCIPDAYSGTCIGITVEIYAHSPYSTTDYLDVSIWEDASTQIGSTQQIEIYSTGIIGDYELHEIYWGSLSVTDLDDFRVKFKATMGGAGNMYVFGIQVQFDMT
jgi:hypothetical protein